MIGMGLFSGRRPARLGIVDGHLHGVRTQFWNAVSSEARTEYHRIAPLAAGPTPRSGFERLAALVAADPAARVIERRPDYLYAEYRTPLMGFVDDVEFRLDEAAHEIHVRSASRLGRKDFGVNRKRVERIRAALKTSHD
jgi:uncharacterized protein (DUF1499 family)